jgi:DNA-binding NtrC family response regulator
MSTSSAAPAILIVDSDIIARHAIAEYLRHCGYAVVEAVNTDEALLALGEASLSIDIIVCDMAAIGTRSGFELASWVRQNRPELEVRLAGSIAGAAETASELCERGPHLERPYEPDAVVDYVKRLRATSDRFKSAATERHAGTAA